MTDTYPLESIDLLITVTLNPEDNNVKTLTADQCEQIITYLKRETTRIQLIIKTQTFTLQSTKAVELLVRQYYSSIINITDIAFANQNRLDDCPIELKKVYKTLLTTLSELISFLEARFAKYLSPEERVNSNYLVLTKSALKVKLDKLRQHLNYKVLQEMPPSKLIFKRLYRFTNTKNHKFEVTFRAIFYKNELVKGLYGLKFENNEGNDVFTSVDKLLIYLNYNSKTYIDQLTQRIIKALEPCDDITEKIERLHYYQKAFKQQHRKPGFKLNPGYHDLKAIMDDWFELEIRYLERLVQFSIVSLPKPTVSPKPNITAPKEINKVRCMLTTDQLGLILRGADEARILVAKSMNQVFRTLVPHLSTPFKENLSYDAMRSKSYIAEARDKDIAIQALEKIINKIKDY